jgi:hypothetical protein
VQRSIRHPRLGVFHDPQDANCADGRGAHRRRGGFVVSSPMCAVRYPPTYRPLACFGSPFRGGCGLCRYRAHFLVSTGCSPILPCRPTRRIKHSCTRWRAQGFLLSVSGTSQAKIRSEALALYRGARRVSLEAVNWRTQVCRRRRKAPVSPSTNGSRRVALPPKLIIEVALLLTCGSQNASRYDFIFPINLHRNLIPVPNQFRTTAFCAYRRQVLPSSQ